MTRVCIRLIVLALGIASGCEVKSKDMPAQRDKGGELFRALAYSDAIAQRFSLPRRDAVQLDSGVLAIAVEVTSDATCSLRVFLDDSVPFAYPPQSQARVADFNPVVGPLFFAARLNDADARARFDRLGEMRVLYRSRSYSESKREGVQDSGPLTSHYRDLLPGLNVVEYTPLCTALDPKHGPADLWLLRAGRSSDELMSVLTSEDQNIAVRITLPVALLKVAGPATARAARQPVSFTLAPQPVYSVPSGG